VAKLSVRKKTAHTRARTRVRVCAHAHARTHTRARTRALSKKGLNIYFFDHSQKINHIKNRNRYWFYGFAASRETVRNFVDDLLEKFWSQVENFVSEMTSTGSGWKFHLICQFDIKHLQSNIGNLIRLGRGRPLLKCAHFRMKVQRLFQERLILDPDYFYHRVFPVTFRKREFSFLHQENTCVLSSLFIRLYCSDDSLQTLPAVFKSRPCLRTLFKDGPVKKLRSLFLNSIHHNHLKTAVSGISTQDFQYLETENLFRDNQFVSRHFKNASRRYKGFSINLYRPVMDDSKQSSNLRLFPVKISKHSNNIEYLQCDLMVDAECLYENGKQLSDKHFPVHHKSRISHAFLLTDLESLIFLRECSQLSTRGRIKKNRLLCRQCLRTFLGSSREVFQYHVSHCNVAASKGLRHRISENVLVHEPYIINSEGKTEKNCLQFPRGDLFRMLKPPIFGSGKKLATIFAFFFVLLF
jgi:hypothetical protein